MPRSRPGEGAGLDLLLVEHDPTFAREISSVLVAHGYVVRYAASGRAGLEASARMAPGLLLVDLELPDVDGIEVCRLIGRSRPCPIVAMGPRGSVARRVQALDEGADDVVDRPPALPELLARLRVVRRHHRSAMAVVSDARICLGALRIDLTGRQVRVGDVPVELTRTEFDLLVLLARNPGKVLGYQLIIDQLGGERRPPVSTAPRVHVCNLRRKLGHSPLLPDIVTVTGVGYRLVPTRDDEASN